MRFGRTLRDASGLGLREIAREIGIDPTSVLRFEKGRSLMNEEALYGYRDALSKRLGRVVTLEEIMRPEPAINGTEKENGGRA